MEPPPPPPEEDIDEAKEKEDEPVYHGENIRIMVMSSEVVQLGKLHIVTEIGKVSFCRAEHDLHFRWLKIKGIDAAFSI